MNENKRDEAKTRLDALDQGSKINQKALKREYQKYLNNQVRLKEQEKVWQLQAKSDALTEMQTFSKYEKEKDDEEKRKRIEMQTAYRQALQSQEYLKAKQKLNTEIKIQAATTHGGTADSVYTFGGTFLQKGPKPNYEKGYINRNPILNPISDPMYNPYLRKDITEGNRGYTG